MPRGPVAAAASAAGGPAPGPPADTVDLVGKDDEIQYLARLGAAGRTHALNKPWSDPARGRYLLDVGGLLSVMPPPPARLLDLGAGSGWSSSMFALAGYTVTVTDISPDMVELQRENEQRYGIGFEASRVVDFESLDYRDEFDVVLFYDCLHHSDDERRALRAAFEALKPGGVCITLEPGRGHHRTEVSRRAAETLGTNERDMPPSLVLSCAREVGFSCGAVFDRPRAPVRIARGKRPDLRGVLEHVKAFLVNATPLAMTRGHIVVLTK